MKFASETKEEKSGRDLFVGLLSRSRSRYRQKVSRKPSDQALADKAVNSLQLIQHFEPFFARQSAMGTDGAPWGPRDVQLAMKNMANRVDEKPASPWLHNVRFIFSPELHRMAYHGMPYIIMEHRMT